MKIIDNSSILNLWDITNTHDDLYFRDLNVTTHSYQNSLVIIDLANAMKTGKRCTRWLLRCAPWHMDNTRLCLMEYIELAFPGNRPAALRLVSLVRDTGTSAPPTLDSVYPYVEEPIRINNNIEPIIEPIFMTEPKKSTFV